MRTLIKYMFAAVLQLAIFSSAAQAAIINPNFEDGLDGWNDLSSTGTVTTNGGFAEFTGGDEAMPFSAVLTQGDDGSFSFFAPINLSSQTSRFEFSLWLINKTNDITETGTSSFADSFTVSFYDSLDGTFDLIFRELDFTAGTLISLDVSALAGRDVAVAFELHDEDDGFNVQIGLDNLLLKERANVPESSGLILIILGLLSLVVSRRFVTP
jgi:hypothetical protein